MPPASNVEVARAGRDKVRPDSLRRGFARKIAMSSWKYYLLLMPALLLSVSIVVIPGILTAYVSFTDWNGVSPDIKWIGLKNFRDIFNDKVFWQALSDNLRWMALFLTIPVVIGLLTAMLLLRRKR